MHSPRPAKLKSHVVLFNGGKCSGGATGSHDWKASLNTSAKNITDVTKKSKQRKTQ